MALQVPGMGMDGGNGKQGVGGAVCEEVPISSGNQLDIAIISDAELAAHGGSERVKSI